MSGPPNESHDCCGDAAAYALGALEPAEAEAFRDHLDGCAICRDELEALTGVVQALPMAAPQHEVPRWLRRRVMHEIRERPSPSAQRRGSSSRGRLAGLASLGPRGAVGAAAAALVIVVVALLIVLGGGGPTAPRARVIEASVSGVSGSVQLRVSAHRGELVARHLSPPPPGQVYEVWLKTPGRAPRPASVLFTVNTQGEADVGIPGSLSSISMVLVTSEPAGGSPAPTHKPVIVAQLT